MKYLGKSEHGVHPSRVHALIYLFFEGGGAFWGLLCEAVLRDGEGYHPPWCRGQHTLFFPEKFVMGSPPPPKKKEKCLPSSTFFPCRV